MAEDSSQMAVDGRLMAVGRSQMAVDSSQWGEAPAFRTRRHWGEGDCEKSASLGCVPRSIGPQELEGDGSSPFSARIDVWPSVKWGLIVRVYPSG